MSLTESLNEIVKDLEEEIVRCIDEDESPSVGFLKGIKTAIKSLAKAAEPAKQAERLNSCGNCHRLDGLIPQVGGGFICEHCDKDRQVRKERGQIREGPKADLEEEMGGRIVRVLDGPLTEEKDGSTSTTIPPNAQINDYLNVCGHRYQLKASGLRHSPEVPKVPNIPKLVLEGK